MSIHAENKENRSRQIQLLYAFLKAHKLAVMATVSGDCVPQAAAVGFVVNQDLELVISSFYNSRKYENIKKNPRVALVIGWEKGKTVQYEGVAVEVDPRSFMEDEFLKMLANVPAIAKYLENEHGVFYKIKPLWVRFADLSQDPFYKFELKF